jgi:hypothetical protein
MVIGEDSMTIQSDFVRYHRSISDELNAVKDRVRHLIGGAHFPTDGEYKEVVLRKVLRGRMPGNFHIGRGFICFRDGPSTQIDVLVTKGDKPVLFKDGDLVFVTPDSVAAILEVKTRLLNPSDYKDPLNKLANLSARIFAAEREYNDQPDQIEKCWTGLFIYDEAINGNLDERQNAARRRSDAVLPILSEVAGGNQCKAINCISAGPDLFIRYWPTGTEGLNGGLHGSGWHSYHFDHAPHRGLAPAYFIGNLIMDICPGLYPEARYYWFPIQDEWGKEQHRLDGIEMGSNEIIHYREY